MPIISKKTFHSVELSDLVNPLNYNEFIIQRYYEPAILYFKFAFYKLYTLSKYSVYMPQHFG